MKTYTITSTQYVFIDVLYYVYTTVQGIETEICPGKHWSWEERRV